MPVDVRTVTIAPVPDVQGVPKTIPGSPDPLALSRGVAGTSQQWKQSQSVETAAHYFERIRHSIMHGRVLTDDSADILDELRRERTEEQ